MASPARTLHAAVSRVEEAWVGALPPFGLVDSDDVSVLVGQMDDGGLLDLVDMVAALGRQVDALTATVAGEVAQRSPVGSRLEGLAHRSGFGSPAKLVAAATGGHVARAAVMTTVGSATAGRRSLTGEALPAVHPHVARVVQQGVVSVEVAHLVIRMLDGLGSRVAPDVVDAAEELLAGQAVGLSLDQVVTLVAEMEAHLDPDGVEPREEVLRRGRSLVVKEDSSGRIQVRGTFDPETGAPIKAALEAYVTNALRVSRGHHHPGGTTCVDDAAGAGGENGAGARVMVETRSVAQIRADGLADFARHVLGCEDRVAGLPVTTVVVRMDLEDLEGRLDRAGVAHLDGLAQPISADTARRLACAAGLIPAVFGGGSVPLDMGRSTRLFTRTQVLALWGRDGGCASCGQTTFVEAHHAAGDWAHGGHTDLADGVLLCSRCHHRVHRHGWEIRIDPAGVWFIPPPSLDPDRTPRPGVVRQTLRERDRQNREP